MTMRPPVRVTPPAALPVTLAEAKAHLRVDHTDSDAMIAVYIEAATGHLDGYSGILGRALINQEWRQDFAGFGQYMRLAMPAASVVSVIWRDAAGLLATVNAAEYALQADAVGPFLRFRDGYSFPADLYQTEAVSITYVSGYGPAPADVPAALRAAILLMIGNLYENRTEVSDRERGSGRIDMSTTVEALIAPYRRMMI